MAWVRRDRTASGATAVQIAESIDGRLRIVRHVGSAREAAEVGLLMDEARRLLEDDQQGLLDLGITPSITKAVMALPPRAGLFSSAASRPATTPVRQAASRTRVLKTSSGLLYEALAGCVLQPRVRDRGREVFRDLVIARIVGPTSLLARTREAIEAHLNLLCAVKPGSPPALAGS